MTARHDQQVAELWLWLQERRDVKPEDALRFPEEPTWELHLARYLPANVAAVHGDTLHRHARSSIDGAGHGNHRVAVRAERDLGCWAAYTSRTLRLVPGQDQYRSPAPERSAQGAMRAA